MTYIRISDEELATRFTYHQPQDGQPAKYEVIRASALSLARDIVALTPLSREQGNSLTALDEVVFWANAAIARRDTPMVETTGPGDTERTWVPTRRD